MMVSTIALLMLNLVRDMLYFGNLDMKTDSINLRLSLSLQLNMNDKFFNDMRGCSWII